MSEAYPVSGHNRPHNIKWLCDDDDDGDDNDDLS